MPQLRINHPYPPALRRSIELALVEGITGDQEQAERQYRSPKSIAERWNRIADSVGLDHGHRRREHIIVALFQRRHVEYLMLCLAIHIGAGLLSDDELVRPGRARTRPGRTSRDSALVWDPDTGTFAGWSDGRDAA